MREKESKEINVVASECDTIVSTDSRLFIENIYTSDYTLQELKLLIMTHHIPTITFHESI